MLQINAIVDLCQQASRWYLVTIMLLRPFCGAMEIERLNP